MYYFTVYDYHFFPRSVFGVKALFCLAGKTGSFGVLEASLVDRILC